MNAIQLTDRALADIDGYIRAGDLATPSMGLFTNTPTLSAATLIADMTEPTFTGYARVALTLEAVRRNAAGSYIEGFGSAHFQPSAGTGLPQIANGYFIVFTFTAVDHLWGAEYFTDALQTPTPFSFNDALSGLDVLWDGMVSNVKQWGGMCATC